MSIDALLTRGDGSDERLDLAFWKPHPLPEDELLWVDLVGNDADEVGILHGALGLSRATDQ